MGRYKEFEPRREDGDSEEGGAAAGARAADRGEKGERRAKDAEGEEPERMTAGFHYQTERHYI